MRKIALIYIIAIIAVLCIFFVSCSDGEEQTFTVPGEWSDSFDGKEEITIDELRVLSVKGAELSFEDLASVYKWFNARNRFYTATTI